jgi:hypothetical protein
VANISGDRAVKIVLRVFEHIRKSVRWDAEMMELIVCSNIVREYLPTKDEERRLWLSYMDKE